MSTRSPEETQKDREGCVNRLEHVKQICLEKDIISKFQPILAPLHFPQLLEEFKIHQAVVVGLGNLDPKAYRDPWRASWQLGVFLLLVRELKSFQDDYNLQIFAQDPAFTPLDVDLLKEYDIEVLETPRAAEVIDQHTLVFAPFIDAAVLLPSILKNKNPAIYVGTDIREIQEKMSWPAYVSS